ncbi:MAG: 1,6-anhydro-N-acetylmuramyl-L-alanine amidase AmpD [Gammaproteobacteria bacterium]|nr:1,6-anhydro-N-acetylmuramyl-L-alanine amidase AmpD [Gammaproteobacteria bacterium]
MPASTSPAHRWYRTARSSASSAIPTWCSGGWSKRNWRNRRVQGAAGRLALQREQHPYFAEIAALSVSSHLLIRRDGESIQYVPLHHRAWHAGESCFSGRERCNDYSIGIELEGTDEQPYTDAQYTALVEVTREIMARYPTITPDRITGHADISTGRKTDPGPAFDWERYRRMLRRLDQA